MLNRFHSNIDEMSRNYGKVLDEGIETEFQAMVDLELLKLRAKRYFDSLTEEELKYQDQIDYMHTL
jgi:hypothetical protein